MGVQKTAPSLQQLAKLEQKAREIGGDTHKAFLIFRYTGAHVSVLTDKRLELHEEINEDDNIVNIVWYRPKKKGLLARTSIPKRAEIDFNVTEWAKDIYKRRRKNTRQYFYTIIKKLGGLAAYVERHPQNGSNSGLSPNSLRHGLGAELRAAGVDDGTIAEILNCSIETVRNHYGKLTDAPKARRLEAIGWNLVKGGK